MTSGQVLSSVFNTTIYSQDRLSYGIEAASSHSLKSLLKAQLQEYDQIESEIQSIAARRYWELPEFRQGIRWLVGCRFRMLLRFHSSDSGIAEMMLCQHTRDMIEAQSILNCLDRHDDQILTILQKLLDCKTANIRQLLLFV